MGPITSILKINENTIVSGSADKEIRVWNWKLNELKNTLKGHNDSVTKIIKLDEEFICSSSDDKTLKLWNLNEDKPFKILKNHSENIKTCDTIFLDKVYIISAGRDNKIVFWE